MTMKSFILIILVSILMVASYLSAAKVNNIVKKENVSNEAYTNIIYSTFGVFGISILLYGYVIYLVF